MTQKQLDRFLEEYNKLDKAHDRYWDKLNATTDGNKRKMYDRKMERYELQMEGLRLGLEIMGYTFQWDSRDDRNYIVEKG